MTHTSSRGDRPMSRTRARDILGVGPDASASDIRRSAHERIRAVHPDSNADSGLSPDEISARINEILTARDLLLDPTRAGEPDTEAEPEEAPAWPHPAAEPHTVDFGTIEQGAEPDTVIVRLYNDGAEVDEVGASPPYDAWWKLVETNEATSEELQHGLLFKLAFAAPAACHFAPGIYQGTHRITADGVILDVPVRLSVRGRTTYPPPRNPSARPTGSTSRPPSGSTRPHGRSGPSTRRPPTSPPPRSAYRAKRRFAWPEVGIGTAVLMWWLTCMPIGLVLWLLSVPEALIWTTYGLNALVWIFMALRSK